MKRIFLFILSILFCSNLYAAEIDQIVFFGDSLSDNGNLYNILKFIPKTPPYYNGRFANGPVWAEMFGDYFKNKYNLSYDDYAYGGATTLSFSSSQKFFSPISLEGEIFAYNTNTTLADKSRTLYVLWIGSNDYLNEDNADGEQLTTDVVNKIAETMNNLINDGAKYFFIVTVPDLSIPPLAQINQNAERMQYLSSLHNQKLEQMLNNMRANPKLRIFVLDPYSLLHDIVSNLDEYNKKYNIHLSNTTQYCWQGGLYLRGSLTQYKKTLREELQTAFKSPKIHKLQAGLSPDSLSDIILKSPDLRVAYQPKFASEFEESDLCKDPDSYMFWDPIHPSVVIHQLLSQIAIEILETQASDLLNN